MSQSQSSPVTAAAQSRKLSKEASPEERKASPAHHQLRQEDVRVITSDEEGSPLKSNGEEGEPMLYVDVNLGSSGTQRIVVYEGDTADALAEKFSVEYSLDESMKEKLVQLL